jgi:hypothetical protein
MTSSGEDELMSLLTEIRSDIRQVKSDIQSLLKLPKQQQEPTPALVSNSDLSPAPVEDNPSGSREEVLRFLRQTRGEDDTGSNGCRTFLTAARGRLYRRSASRAQTAIQQASRRRPLVRDRLHRYTRLVQNELEILRSALPQAYPLGGP